MYLFSLYNDFSRKRCETCLHILKNGPVVLLGRSVKIFAAPATAQGLYTICGPRIKIGFNSIFSKSPRKAFLS